MFKQKANTATGEKPRPAETVVAPDDPSIVEQCKGKKLVATSKGLLITPPALLNSAALQEIILDCNRLTTVPLEVFQLPSLKKLSLDSNYISWLDTRCITDCGKKLSTVSLEENPLGWPPLAVATKGWSFVKKWVPANPSFVTYRLFTHEEGDKAYFVDINYCAMRDTMVKSKDEDRDVTYIRPIGAAEVTRLPTIDRHLRDQRDKAIQTGPGWTSAPFTGTHHLVPIQHMYCAVFDGHAGAWVAQALTTNLYKKLAEANVFAEEKIEYEPVIRKIFMDLDKIVCDKLREGNMNDGSTCVTCTLKGPEMIFAHVGDSRAVGKIAKKDVELTKDHDPGQHKDEKERVEKRGGKVTFHSGCWRINNNLSVSRAFGDTNMKQDEVPIVDADPDVSVRPLNADVEFLVVASDGLYHLIDTKDVIKFVSGKTTAEEAAIALFQDVSGNARSQLKGHDNTTIIVLKLTTHCAPKEMRESMMKPL